MCGETGLDEEDFQFINLSSNNCLDRFQPRENDVRSKRQTGQKASVEN